MGNRNKKAHDRFVGCEPLTVTMDIVSIEGQSLVLGTVVKDSVGNLMLQLDYLAKKTFKDSAGYIGVRWTKRDLERMLSLLELTEEKHKQDEETDG